MNQQPQSNEISVLRHDLRTPLNQIIGYSELLQEEITEEAHLADLTRILTASHHLVQLIDQSIDPRRIKLLQTTPLPAPTKTSPQPVVSDLETKQVRQLAHGTILVVDDNPENCDVLVRRLTSEGYATHTAGDGHEALVMLLAHEIDLVLLDVIMPDFDGHQVLNAIKQDPQLRHIPVIMVTALDELRQAVRCIENGADDYLTKPVNPTMLRARMGSSLDRKRLRDQEQRALHELQETQKKLMAELAEAAAYVGSQLPAHLTSPIPIEWTFIPSSTLGGDAFDYFWLDESHLALHLVDVCGHGVSAALFSLEIMKSIRERTLQGVNYFDPSAVLQALNNAFPMEKHHNMFFTMWYGVYHVPTRTMKYSSGGHPPGLLFTADSEPKQLRTANLVLGIFADYEFVSESCLIPANSRFYLISDGTYEIQRPHAAMMTLGELTDYLRQQRVTGSALFQNLHAHLLKEQGAENLDDDFSLVEFMF